MEVQDKYDNDIKTEVLENESKIESFNVGVNLYKCDVCNQTCISQQKLTKHMEGHIKSELPYVMDDFEAYEMNVEEIKMECIIESDGVYNDTQQEVYICDMCNSKFGNKLDIEIHIIESHGDIAEQDLPNLKNNNKSNCKRETGKKSPQICSICKKTYKTKGGLIKHLQNFKHGQKFSCSICNFKCSSKRDLAEHKKVHLEEILKIFTCKKCSKRFLSRDILNQHKKTKCKHNKDTNAEKNCHTCDVCEKKFKTATKLLDHLKTHSEIKPYSCCVCDYKSKYRNNLIRHERKHTGEKPYKCSTCGHKCSHKSSLTYHMRTHTGEKPYKCSVCDKKFVTSSALATHTKIHTGDKKYSCKLCSYKSIKPREMRYHEEKVHFIEN